MFLNLGFRICFLIWVSICFLNGSYRCFLIWVCFNKFSYYGFYRCFDIGVCLRTGHNRLVASSSFQTRSLRWWIAESATTTSARHDLSCSSVALFFANPKVILGDRFGDALKYVWRSEISLWYHLDRQAPLKTSIWRFPNWGVSPVLIQSSWMTPGIFQPPGVGDARGSSPRIPMIFPRNIP
jgi:hypothetical protein